MRGIRILGSVGMWLLVTASASASAADTPPVITPPVAPPIVAPPIVPLPAVAPPVIALPEPTLIPALFSFSAGEESSFAVKPGGESYGLGGVVIGYENVRLFCDTLRFWKSVVAGSPRELPQRCLLLSGPKGQDPERVVIDSRASQLPEVAFRGLMKPGQVEMIRLDQTEPTVVRFQVTLSKLGNFTGLLRSDQGWQPYAGWAETAVIVMRGDLVAATGELVNQRFDAIHLYGRKRDGDQPKERALFLRLKQPLGEDVPAKSVKEIDCKAGIRGMTVTMFFAPDGTVARASTGMDGSQFGTEMFGGSPISEPSKPVILPLTAPVTGPAAPAAP